MSPPQQPLDFPCRQRWVPKHPPGGIIVQHHFLDFLQLFSFKCLSSKTSSFHSFWGNDKKSLQMLHCLYKLNNLLRLLRASSDKWIRTSITNWLGNKLNAAGILCTNSFNVDRNLHILCWYMDRSLNQQSPTWEKMGKGSICHSFFSFNFKRIYKITFHSIEIDHENTWVIIECVSWHWVRGDLVITAEELQRWLTNHY